MTTLSHYLRPLLVPTSLAVVGATNRQGSIGRVLLENLVAGGFAGDMHFVNPHHRRAARAAVVTRRFATSGNRSSSR